MLPVPVAAMHPSSTYTLGYAGFALGRRGGPPCKVIALVSGGPPDAPPAGHTDTPCPLELFLLRPRNQYPEPLHHASSVMHHACETIDTHVCMHASPASVMMRACITGRRRPDRGGDEKWR